MYYILYKLRLKWVILTFIIAYYSYRHTLAHLHLIEKMPFSCLLFSTIARD